MEFIIIARIQKTGKLSMTKGHVPVAHNTVKSATAEATRLSSLPANKGKSFEIWVQVNTESFRAFADMEGVFEKLFPDKS